VRDKGDRMLLLLLRWFGMVLTLVFAVILISSLDRGHLTEYSITRGQPESLYPFDRSARLRLTGQLLYQSALGYRPELHA
jgi:hypothetical protein